MNPPASEYLPQPNENEHKKVFQLAPVEDDLGVQAPILRRKVRQDGSLSPVARLVYDHLSDYAFLTKLSPARGVIDITKPRLASELGVSVRTILRKTRELEARRWLWTKTYWFAGFEMTRWFLRGIADAQEELFRGPDPRFSKVNGRNRHLAARGSNGQFCPLDGVTVKMAEKRDLSGQDGQPCPATTDTGVLPGRSPVSGGAGHPCPASPDSRVRPGRSSVTVDAGQPCPARPVNGDRGGRTPVTGYKDSPDTFKDSGEVKPAFKRLDKRAGAGSRVNGRQGENSFMTFCLAVLTKPEMDGNGGMWRTLFRQNSAKAWRVMREVEATIRERPGEVRTNRGAYAMDLWKRFAD